jgi:hypothetical protein
MAGVSLCGLSEYNHIYIRRPQGTKGSAPEKQCQTESFSEGEEGKYPPTPADSKGKKMVQAARARSQQKN